MVSTRLAMLVDEITDRCLTSYLGCRSARRLRSGWRERDSGGPVAVVGSSFRGLLTGPAAGVLVSSQCFRLPGRGASGRAGGTAPVMISVSQVGGRETRQQFHFSSRVDSGSSPNFNEQSGSRVCQIRWRSLVAAAFFPSCAVRRGHAMWVPSKRGSPA
ncbi:hypothetical protein VTK73DRAFT_4639 [Phialemonium thermophilum]|uniref:Uncharacterized protein n=1 Tax=Phialemonium thermophilum TaxID=223376 RepID=A0ABR3V7A2_9PEZI